MTPDGLPHHVGGYRRKGDLSSPTQGGACHSPAALMYVLRNVLVDGEHQAQKADVAWPEPLRPRPHTPTLVWLVMTDNLCAQRAEQAQLWAEWVVVQEGRASPGPANYPAAPPCWWLRQTRTWRCTR